MDDKVAADVVIVGASVAGVGVADALRAAGFEGSLVLADAEPGLPCDKPPLSKQALRPGWEPARGLLRPREHYERHGIRLVLGNAVVALAARGGRTLVRLADGSAFDAATVVLAPGARARTLPREVVAPGLRGVHAIRTEADSAGIRASLAPGCRLVVVGGGFIGAEAAGVAAELGADVTIVEQQRLPFLTLFGEAVAGALCRRHTERGVTVLGGASVERIEGESAAETVLLADGRRIPADLVLLGLGAEPRVEWLAGSGIALGDGVGSTGILCDEYGRTSLPGVYAAGDAAAWRDAGTGAVRRIEHWTTAKEQAAVVASNILRPESETLRGVPYFWSDQHGGRLQFLGTTEGFDRAEVVHGSLEGGQAEKRESWVVLYGRAGTLVGALGLSSARRLMPYRPRILEGAGLDDVLGEVRPH
ncbi:FAD-dependent oxidoreductase [Saccharomonospora sp. NPDC006951]